MIAPVSSLRHFHIKSLLPQRLPHPPFHPSPSLNPSHSPSQSRSVFQDLFHSSKEHAQDGLLDVLVAVDGRGKGACQHIKHILQQKRARNWNHLLPTHTHSPPSHSSLHPSTSNLSSSPSPHMHPLSLSLPLIPLSLLPFTD